MVEITKTPTFCKFIAYNNLLTAERRFALINILVILSFSLVELLRWQYWLSRSLNQITHTAKHWHKVLVKVILLIRSILSDEVTRKSNRRKQINYFFNTYAFHFLFLNLLNKMNQNQKYKQKVLNWTILLIYARFDFSKIIIEWTKIHFIQLKIQIF